MTTRQVLVAIVCFMSAMIAAQRVAASASITSVRSAYDLATRQYQAQHLDSAAQTYVRVAMDGAALPADSIWRTVRDSYYNAACCKALLHDADQAFALLDSAAAHGFWDVNFISLDKDLKLIRRDARYGSLIAHIQFAKDSLAAVIDTAPPLCRVPHASSSTPMPVLIVLHDEMSSPKEAVEFWSAVADSSGCIVAAVHGAHVHSPREFSFGLDADSADRRVHAAIRFVEERYRPGHKYILAGVKQGAVIAYQLGMKHPELFCGVLAVNGYYNAGYCRKFISNVRRSGLCVYGIYDPANVSVSSSNLRAIETMRTSAINAELVSEPFADIVRDGQSLNRALDWILHEH